ncbi:MAG: hypothetical protein HQM08_18665 [Candidatus Riflebacteria bacterium]|nr:hypothetical protein [Candidatus Riflebacteria bacterium]
MLKTLNEKFQNCQKLFEIQQAFSHDSKTVELFELSMKEALNWHLQNCPDFASFIRKKGFDPSLIQKSDEIPPIFVTIFKEFRLISIPQQKIKIELTSSGTGGQKSSIVLDDTSLKRILKVVSGVFSSLGLKNEEESVNYICFAYDPKYASSKGTTFSDKQLTYLTKRKSVFYAIKWNSGKQDFEFDLDLTLKKLLAFSKQDYPVRILGFPAYLWQLCEKLSQKNISLKLGNRSFVITGGGWKIFKDREVNKDYFKETVSKVLGLPSENIRDTFGLVEHGIPYLECEKGKMHIPIYSRARVVDPETLFPLSTGTEGLLHLMTPYLTSYPSISILTTDRAIIEKNCPCGRPGDTLKIVGRAGLSKHKGCAISALDYLK